MSLESSVAELVGEASSLIETFKGKKAEIDQAVNAALSGSVKPLTMSLNYTVGAGGQFETINDALVAAGTYKANKRNDGSSHIITIKLLSGFVVQEQILLNHGADFSHVFITSEDDVVPVDCTYLTIVFWSRKPLFSAANRAQLPMIGCLFDMMPEGRDGLHDGIVLNTGAGVQLQTGAGVINAGGRGMYLSSCSLAAGFAVNFSGAGLDCIALYDASSARLDGSDFSGAGNHGAYVSASTLSADESNFSGAVESGILAISMADVRASESDCRKVEGEDSTIDIVAQSGSRVAANNSLGGTNITPNTWSGSGIIYKL